MIICRGIVLFAAVNVCFSDKLGLGDSQISVGSREDFFKYIDNNRNDQISLEELRKVYLIVDFFL